MARRKQCEKCPWRIDVDPNEIPNGYCVTKHEALRRTIAQPGAIRLDGPLHMMACHESHSGHEIPCVGWLAHQLGPGNNIALRIRAMTDCRLGEFELVGEQHRRFEDTLPRKRRRKQQPKEIR